MLKELDGYDWKEVFKYTDPTAAPPTDKDVSTAGFTIDDVKKIVAKVDGANDETDWVMVGILRDGRYFCIRAGCDYTGWGCQEGGSSDVAQTKEAIIAFGLTQEERERLGLKIR